MARSNYNNILLFIGFTVAAAILWFLFRYNGTYEEYVDVAVVWNNVPVDLKLSKKSSKIKVPVKVQSSGFKLLWLDYSPLETPLDFKDYVESSGEQLFFEPEKARSMIDRSIGKGFEVLEIDTKPIALEYQRYASKKVALSKKFKLNFKGNFKEIGVSGFEVPQVTITGNDVEIESINSLIVERSPVSISDSLTVVNIDLGKQYPDLKIDPAVVSYKVQAAQMTEGTFKIPVVLKNLPDGVKVKLIPDVVSVIYTCRLTDYDKIERSDFEVIIDLDTFNRNDITAIPELNYTGSSIYEARLQPQSVQILMIQ